MGLSDLLSTNLLASAKYVPTNPASPPSAAKPANKTKTVNETCDSLGVKRIFPEETDLARTPGNLYQIIYQFKLKTTWSSPEQAEVFRRFLLSFVSQSLKDNPCGKAALADRFSIVKGIEASARGLKDFTILVGAAYSLLGFTEPVMEHRWWWPWDEYKTWDGINKVYNDGSWDTDEAETTDRFQSTYDVSTSGALPGTFGPATIKTLLEVLDGEREMKPPSTSRFDKYHKW